MFVCGDNLSLVWFQSFLHVLCCIKFIVNDYCTCKHRLIYICFSGGWSLEKEKQKKNLFSVHLITAKPWLKSFDGKPKMSFVHVWFSKPYLWLSTWPVLLDAHNASILWSLCIWKQLYFHWGDIMLMFTLIHIHSQGHWNSVFIGKCSGTFIYVTGSEVDDEEMKSDDEDSDDSWTTQEELNSDTIMRYT